MVDSNPGMAMAAPSGAPSAERPASPVRRPSRRRLWLAAGVVILAVFVLAGVVGSWPTPSGSSGSPATPGTTVVNVTSVDWQFTGATNCWSATNSSGMVVPAGKSATVSVMLTGATGAGAPASCTIASETVATTGFSLESSNAPLSISPGQTGTLVVSVRAPSANETVTLTLVGEVRTTTNASSVNVSAVNWQFSGASNCWGTLSGKGTVVAGGDQFTVTVRLSYTAGLLQPSSCTVRSISVATTGFALSGSNAPLVVSSGGSATLSATLVAPSASETVVLTIDGQVTSP